MIPLREKVILLVVFVAVLITVYVCTHGGLSLKADTKPGIADNEEMHAEADNQIVGQSNVTPDPVSRASLANIRFLTGPLGMPMLRQITIGRSVTAEILNQRNQ